MSQGFILKKLLITTFFLLLPSLAWSVEPIMTKEERAEALKKGELKIESDYFIKVSFGTGRFAIKEERSKDGSNYSSYITGPITSLEIDYIHQLPKNILGNNNFIGLGLGYAFGDTTKPKSDSDYQVLLDGEGKYSLQFEDMQIGSLRLIMGKLIPKIGGIDISFDVHQMRANVTGTAEYINNLDYANKNSKLLEDIYMGGTINFFFKIYYRLEMFIKYQHLVREDNSDKNGFNVDTTNSNMQLGLTVMF